MMKRSAPTALLVFAAIASSAAANERAPFINGTYVMEGRCEKLKAIEAGGPKNIETMPEILTADGFETWEGGCSFISIKETQKGRRWVAKMACAEAADEGTEIDTFDLDPESGKIKVTVEGKTNEYVRCSEGKGK